MYLTSSSSRILRIMFMLTSWSASSFSVSSEVELPLVVLAESKERFRRMKKKLILRQITFNVCKLNPTQTTVDLWAKFAAVTNIIIMGKHVTNSTAYKVVQSIVKAASVITRFRCRIVKLQTRVEERYNLFDFQRRQICPEIFVWKPISLH